MEHFGDRFVDEALDEKMASIAQRDQIAAIQWARETGHHRLWTPYGVLDVWKSVPPGWHVNRNGAPLVHARSPHEALFTSAAAAAVAGLIHLADGFDHRAPCQDGLWWKMERPAPQHFVAPPPVPVDPSISDDDVWGRQRLEQLLKQSGIDGCAEDENLIIDLRWRASAWQVLQPKWTERAQGCWELDTPYGTLVVRRLIGWTVERDGSPLIWCIRDDRVIFDRLEHAKLSALVHAADIGAIRFYDGTQWEEPGDKHLTDRRELLNHSPAAGGSHVVAG
jgi:hypothetical protein